MTTSAQIPTLFRADVVIGPYRRVFDKLEFAMFTLVGKLGII